VSGLELAQAVALIAAFWLIRWRSFGRTDIGCYCVAERSIGLSWRAVWLSGEVGVRTEALVLRDHLDWRVLSERNWSRPAACLENGNDFLGFATARRWGSIRVIEELCFRGYFFSAFFSVMRMANDNGDGGVFVRVVSMFSSQNFVGSKVFVEGIGCSGSCWVGWHIGGRCCGDAECLSGHNGFVGVSRPRLS